MKKTVFFIFVLIFLVFNISGFLVNQNKLNNIINQEKKHYSYLAFISENGEKDIDNKKLESFFKKEKINILRNSTTESKTTKEVYFPQDKDFEYLHLSNSKELTKDYYYSNNCSNFDNSCSKINYTIENIEYRYIFSDINKNLLGNYYIDIKDVKIETLKNIFEEVGYDVKIEKNDNSNYENTIIFKDVNIARIVFENILSIILFVFIANYVITSKSKKIGIQVMLGEKKKNILFNIVKEYSYVLFISFIFAQIISFLFLFLSNNIVFWDLFSSIIFYIFLSFSMSITLIVSGFFASKTKISGLIKNGFRASKIFTFFNFAIQVAIFVTITFISASAFRLIDFQSEIKNVYSEKEISKYQTKNNIVPFQFNSSKIRKIQEEGRGKVNLFLNEIDYGYVSSLSGLRNKETGILDIDIPNKTVYTNKNFLDFSGIKLSNCEKCILIGESRKKQVSENSETFEKYFSNFFSKFNLNEDIRFYDDSKKIEIRTMRFKQDSNELNYYESPIFIVKPTNEVTNLSPNGKTDVSFFESGDTNFYYLDCQNNCKEYEAADKFLESAIKNDVAQYIYDYTDIPSEAKQVKNESDAILFNIFSEFIKALLFATVIIVISIQIRLEIIKKKIAVNFLVGNTAMDIIKEYIVSIVIMFAIVNFFAGIINELLDKSDIISFKISHLVAIELTLFAIYLFIYYFGVKYKIRKIKISEQLKGDI